MSIKVCRQCKKEFEHDWKSRNYICRPCNADVARAYREKKKAQRHEEFINTASGEFRKCSECLTEMPLTEFSRSSYSNKGRAYLCKSCNQKSCKKRRDADRIEANIRKRLSFFKITREEYDALHERARGLCEICGTDKSADNRPLGIDHCHESGKIRGILCNKCNWLIGASRENVDILNKAIGYLQERTT